MDFVWENFGLLEWLFVLELIVLLTALFFYQVAKIIARTDRHDPLVRFYRVFWRSFLSDVSSYADIEFNAAEAAAMSAGYGAEVNTLDAPDLGTLNESEMRQVPSEAELQSRQQPAPRGAAPSGGGNTQDQNVSATFEVMINPMAGRDAIVGMKNGSVVIDVKCAAEDGQANGTIIDLIAPRIGMRPYQISLIRGHYKVLKAFRVQQIDQPALNARLQRLG